MAVNKVIYGDQTLIDLTDSTVTSGDLREGAVAYDRSGSRIVGTITNRSSSDLSVNDDTVIIPQGYYGEQATKSVPHLLEIDYSELLGTESWPLGWRNGYYDSSTGESGGGTRYIKTLTGGGAEIIAPSNAQSMYVKAPDGYYIAIYEYNASDVYIRRYGVANDLSGTGTNEVAITPTPGYIYKLCVGMTASDVDSTTLITQSFISQIICRFYFSPLVTVPGANICQGTFTTGSTGDANGTFETGYNGNGYPIALIIYVDGGPYNNGTGGNTTWYNSVIQYDCGYYSMMKARMTTAPTYLTSGEDNYGCVAIIYKNSTTSGTTYTRTSNMTVNAFSAASGTAAASTAMCRFKGNNHTVTYYCGNATSSTIGFARSTKYAFIAIYSE